MGSKKNRDSPLVTGNREKVQKDFFNVDILITNVILIETDYFFHNEVEMRPFRKVILAGMFTLWSLAWDIGNPWLTAAFTVAGILIGVLLYRKRKRSNPAEKAAPDKLPHSIPFGEKPETQRFPAGGVSHRSRGSAVNSLLGSASALGKRAAFPYHHGGGLDDRRVSGCPRRTLPGTAAGETPPGSGG